MIFRRMVSNDRNAVSKLAVELGYPNRLMDIAKRFAELSGRKDHAVIVAENEHKEVTMKLPQMFRHRL